MAACDNSVTQWTSAPHAWWRRDDGSATIEAVLWMPFFLAAFTFVVDGTMIFHNHSQILRVVQDANRGLSVGRYDTEAETETEIEARLASVSPNTNATTSISAGVIRTTVTVPAADLDVIGMFAGLAAPTLTLTTQHFLEQ